MMLSTKSTLSLCYLRKFLNATCLKYLKRELSFQELGVNVKLARYLRSRGIQDPTDIQQKAIISILAGKDVVINAETGSGKTLAYAIPMVNKIQELKRMRLPMPRPYGLVVVPSRELQLQVANVFKGLLGTKVCEASEDTPMRLIDTEIVVSTVQYLMTYDLDVYKYIQTVVFDEADVMFARKVEETRKEPLFHLLWYLLKPANYQCPTNDGDKCVDLGSRDILSNRETSNGLYDGDNSLYDGDDVLYESNLDDRDYRSSTIGKGRKFVFVGATMPHMEREYQRAAMNYIRHYKPYIDVIQTQNSHKLVPNVQMIYSKVFEANKLKLLVQMLQQYTSQDGKLQVLVFVNKVETATMLHTALTEFSYKNKHVAYSSSENNFPDTMYKFHIEWEGNIHLLTKEIPLHRRFEILNEFSACEGSMVITTDVASRGIDFRGVDLVVQFDFATNVIDIIHRAGRTGRMGSPGKVVNFITKGDQYLAKSIEQATLNGEKLDNLFSRKQSLKTERKKYANKRGDNNGRRGLTGRR